jgi:hypothetical protein
MEPEPFAWLTAALLKEGAGKPLGLLPTGGEGEG